MGAVANLTEKERRAMREIWAAAEEVANEAVGFFSKKHPDIKMNYDQWSDLKEMIEREVMGHFLEGSNEHACDLLKVA